MMRPLVLCLISFLAGPAVAESDDPGPLCLDADEMVPFMLRTYGEVLAGGGPNVSGGGTALFINPQTDEWTILRGVNGLACIADAGTGWIITGEPA